MWDSPLIARIGRIDASLNILSCIDVVGPALGFPTKDVHSVLVRDAQVFVEKRRNVFNFHLLDPSLQLPDADEIMASLLVDGGTGAAIPHRGGAGGGGVGRKTVLTRSGSLPLGAAGRASLLAPHDDDAAGGIGAYDNSQSLEAEAKAETIVNNLVGAVSTMGRAANQGGTKGLHLALMDQKEGFVTQLREFQAKLGTGGHRGAEEEGSPGRGGGRGSSSYDRESGRGRGMGRPPMKKAQSALGYLATDSANVMKHLGKVVEKNVSDIKQQVDSFHKPPPKKEGFVNPGAEFTLRFGNVVCRDVRIFTKDMIAMNGATGDAASTATDTPAARAGGTRTQTIIFLIEEPH